MRSRIYLRSKIQNFETKYIAWFMILAGLFQVELYKLIIKLTRDYESFPLP